MDPYMASGPWDVEMAESISPAELSAIDIWDLSIYSDPFELPMEPTAPINIPDLSTVRLQNLPKHSRVSLLSTSPPDVGWQWGYDPMSIGPPARRPSHGQLAISRATSSSSIPHLSTSPQLGYKKAKPGRGRLFADTSAQGPETVFEDSDSHHSWTSSENFETWCNSLREHLADFRRCKSRVAIITSLLQTRQRRKVHSMANLLGLSHMSVGSGRTKQVLISKCEMVKSDKVAGTSCEKRWNPIRHNWSRGLVDPRIVLIDGLDSSKTAFRLQQHLYEVGLPQPKHVVVDSAENAAVQSGCPLTAYAYFETPEDASTVVLALDHTTPNWNAHEGYIECDYVRFRPGTDLDGDCSARFESLPQLLRESSSSKDERKDSDSNDQNIDCALYSASEDESDAFPSPSLTVPQQRFASRLASNDSSRSKDAGYASGSSALSLALSDYNEGSANKKRKRFPKIQGGFPCQFVDCDKVFDRDGDRRKHEKNHTGQRKYTCDKCSRGFLFPKDLKRHMNTHSTMDDYDSWIARFKAGGNNRKD